MPARNASNLGEAVVPIQRDFVCFSMTTSGPHAEQEMCWRSRCYVAVTHVTPLAHFMKRSDPASTRWFAVHAVPTLYPEGDTQWRIRVNAVLRRWTRRNSAKLRAKVAGRRTPR